MKRDITCLMVILRNVTFVLLWQLKLEVRLLCIVLLGSAIHLLTEAANDYKDNNNEACNNILKTVAHCRRQRGNCFIWNHSFQLQLA
jgi:hypothetical protein